MSTFSQGTTVLEAVKSLLEEISASIQFVSYGKLEDKNQTVEEIPQAEEELMVGFCPWCGHTMTFCDCGYYELEDGDAETNFTGNSKGDGE